jgi:Zn finger protein HypA/HybF involved in hydrogenase expression
MEEEKIYFHCTKCHHDWKQRGKKKPKRCPCCKNPNWDIRNVKDLARLMFG